MAEIKTWRDKSNGKDGNQIWIPVIISIALVATYVCLILPMYSFSKPITPFIFLSSTFLLFEVFMLFYISQAINVLKEITLDGDKLCGKCYFGRQINCVVSDIDSLSFYPMTWKIRYINLFDPKKPGINIVLKNGDLFRINAKTDGFDSLVDALKALPNESNRRKCDLNGDEQIGYFNSSYEINTWCDKTLGKNGGKIWFFLAGSIALVTFYFYDIFPKFLSMSFFNSKLAGVFYLLPAAGALFYCSQTINVLQEIILDGDSISGKCYFGRRLKCVASDIKSISYYPMTWQIRGINLFDPKKPGINIELQDGNLFRINARTERFSCLVDALKALAKKSNQTRCDL
jgi:hypothetical protein